MRRTIDSETQNVKFLIIIKSFNDADPTSEVMVEVHASYEACDVDFESRFSDGYLPCVHIPSLECIRTSEILQARP